MLVSLAFLTFSMGCDLIGVNRSRDIHDVLTARAVEVVARAASDEWSEDGRLADLIAPEATFSLGAGDVGRPLGAGPEGAHAMARLLHADAYRYLGWDYMNTPADACARREIQVTFDDGETDSTATVTFVFENGKVVSAAGWHRSFVAGDMVVVPLQ